MNMHDPHRAFGFMDKRGCATRRTYVRMYRRHTIGIAVCRVLRHQIAIARQTLAIELVERFASATGALPVNATAGPSDDVTLRRRRRRRPRHGGRDVPGKILRISSENCLTVDRVSVQCSLSRSLSLSLFIS